MAIHRPDPMRDLNRLQERMNRLFDEMLTRTALPGVVESDDNPAWRPPTDLFEDGGRYVLRADLPGVEPGEVELTVEKGRLVLRGERRRDDNIDEGAYLRVERPGGRFNVQIALPPSVDPRRIGATHRNGVLEVSLPKRDQDATGRIEVAIDA